LQWKEITVGDLIIVRQDEAFPCDIVIFSTSNVDGIAYMNTASLDGEKSLKPIISLTKT
jgi:P-type E1-E2 ATPase